MAVVKVIELIASSENGFDDAVRQAVKEASKTIRNIDSVWVKDMKAHVKDGKISSYGVICNVSFRLDNGKAGKKDKKGKKQKKDIEDIQS
jgi:flavin-binding protein dodecin